MDGWKMSFLLGFPIFRGYVKLRGGNIVIIKNKITAESATQRFCLKKQESLGGGFKLFVFSYLPGKMIQFDDHIF